MGNQTQGNNVSLDDQSVQATLLLAIYGRAKASKMFSSVLYDSEAVEIVEGMDYDFSDINKSYGTEFGCLSCLVRARRLDERCIAYLNKYPEGTIVNMGAGLDTSFSRVDNGKVKWFNVDLPDSMHLRNQLITKNDRCTNIAKSMFDYSWHDDISKQTDITKSGEKIFILAGGLFYYFTPVQVRDFFVRTIDRFEQGEIFFDAQSKSAVNASNKLIRKTGNKGSEMMFWVNNAQELKSWSKHIQSIESVAFFGDLKIQERLKLSTKIRMTMIDGLKMGQLISVNWSHQS